MSLNSVWSTHSLVSLSALRSRLSALEGELCSKATMLKSIQNELTQSKKELAARELIVQKSRDELSLAHTHIARESERVKRHTTTATDKTACTTSSEKMCFIPVLMFYVSLKPCCFSQNGCWPHLLKHFSLTSLKMTNMSGVFYCIHNRLLSAALKKVEVEKPCPCSVLSCKTIPLIFCEI